LIAYDLPGGAPFDAAGNWTPSWAQWLTRTHRAALAVQQSGPTAERPASLLWIGRPFYDTTLNEPIWLAAVNPSVWRNAAGIAV
jgi:hypothetical protein